MIGIALAVLVFLVAAAVSWHQGGDSVTLGALFILATQIVKAISDHLGRMESAKRDADNAKKIDQNTQLTAQIGNETKQAVAKVADKVAEKTVESVQEVLKDAKG